MYTQTTRRGGMGRDVWLEHPIRVSMFGYSLSLSLSCPYPMISSVQKGCGSERLSKYGLACVMEAMGLVGRKSGGHTWPVVNEVRLL